jgi:metal-responsive CopG/Arc/MetJ family transcriptional regulator
MVVNPASMVRKLVSLPHDLVTAIDDFRFKNRIKTESETIRQLLEAGLCAKQFVTSDQLISFCRDKQKYDIAQYLESIVFEINNPSDLPLGHSFPLTVNYKRS